MIANHGSYNYHYMSLDGQQSFFDQYGCRAVLGWLSARVFRSGHKLPIQMLACVSIILLLTHSLPQRATDVALGRGYSGWLEWARGKSDADGDAVNGGNGMRVVVFGASDIASVQGGVKGDISWPMIMCEQLECSTYTSLVPKAPSRSMSSNSIYASAMDKVMRLSPQNASKAPGLDYSIIPQKFPVPWEQPDLAKQVADFLAMPVPKKAPRETIWVFNFGHWDVWNLAAFPLKLSEPVIDAMVADVVINIEKLFSAASNTTSIAYSKRPVIVDSRKPSVISKAPQPTSAVGDAAKPETTEQAPEVFRIMVPMIFDATLSPGWNSERPELPPAHSKAEQMRNAAMLTERWNNKLQGAVEDWVKSEEQRAEQQVSPVDHGVQTIKRHPTATAQPFAASTPSAAPSAAAASRLPLTRDAIIYDLQEYVTEMMAERQMRDHGYVDQNGVGGRTEDKLFREIFSPCVNGTQFKAPKTINPSSAVPPSDEEEDQENDYPGTWAENQRRSMRIKGSPAGGAAKKEESVEPSDVCEEPEEHLFYTALTLSPRAINDIGRETAELVATNMTLRGYWAGLMS